MPTADWPDRVEDRAWYKVFKEYEFLKNYLDNAKLLPQSRAKRLHFECLAVMAEDYVKAFKKAVRLDAKKQKKESRHAGASPPHTS